MESVLAADIGGTNARFAIVEKPQDAARIAFSRTYPTTQFATFEQALDAFLREAGAARGGPLPARGAIALAGPVGGEEACLVNRAAWRVERRALAARGIEALLLNDFAALAHGVARAQSGDTLVLQAGAPRPKGTIALVGAGTGLGVAALVWRDGRYHPMPSEAGHMSFAAQSDVELALARDLARAYGRVSAERVVSGPGLAAIYRHLAGAQAESDDPKAVSARGLADASSTQARALDLFVACYGAFAGDIALAFLAEGGVFVCGGIAARLAARLAAGDFIAAFNNKGRHAALTAAMPVRLVTNERLGLLGAAYAVAG